MDKNPLVSILIVSFNTKGLLLDCVASIESYVKSSYEIIIIDNDSRDGTPRAIKKLRNKKVRLIENKENVGFAKANNQGIDIARGKYILLLNSDTYLTQDAVSDCVKVFEKNPQIGAMSCQLKNPDDSVQPTGGYFPTPWRIFLWMSFFDDLPILSSIVNSFHPPVRFYSKSRPLDWVTGAFFMIPRQVIARVGKMDEDYFMYVEEVDWCYRMGKLGLSAYYVHETSIVHLGQASSTNEFAIKSEFKNILIFYKKHFPHFLWYARVILKVGVALRILVFAILRKDQQKTIYEKTLSVL